MSSLSTNLISKFKSLFHSNQHSQFREFNAEMLKQSGSPDVEKLRNVLLFIKSQSTWSQQEQELFQKINIIKENYSKSDEKLLIKDFGAGPKRAISDEILEKNDVLREVFVSNAVKNDATPEKWGKLLFKIVRDFKFKYCLELGTNLGISASYLISALKLNQSGKLVTIEGAEAYAKLAVNNLDIFQYENFHVLNGKFTDVLPKILSKEQAIDFVFIDGHHDEEATKMYFNMIFPFLSQHSMVIFDDINWSSGMKNAWKDLYHDKRVRLSVDLGKWGICLIDKSCISKELNYFKLAL